MKKLHLCLSLLVLTAVLLVTLLGPVGCKSSAPAGTEIRIGVLGGQTGPASAEVVRLFDELGHVFDYINEVEGGVEGAAPRRSHGHRGPRGPPHGHQRCRPPSSLRHP